MSTSIRIRKNLLGEYAPDIQKKSLCDLLRDSYFNKINSRPVYQRHIRWNPTAMNDFIGTIMNNGLVPGLIMYQLASDERTGKNETKSFEMVDGQHRLFTLKAFMESTIQILPHIKKPFVVYWNYETISEDGTPKNYQVFYQRTDDVDEFCRDNTFNPMYLSDEEKEYFDNFGVNLTLIRSKLSLNQRREIFMSLQKGIPVRNSDFLKNKTDCKLVAFMSENNYEEMMTDVFLKHCYKNASNYWIHWVCRCFFLYKHFNRLFKKEEFNNKDVCEIFLYQDKKFKKLIESNIHELNPRTEEEYQIIYDFDDIFRLFIAFLQRFDENHFLNPTQIFALFYVLCDESKDTDIILSHIHNLSIAGKSKSKKNLWESHDEVQPRRDYFNRCLKFISSINERAPDIDTTPISNQLKKQVWAKCVNGKCHICEDEINEKDFEAGHIEARALGGPTIIENLIPMCFACNRGMGTRNAYEFKKDMYPEYELVSQEIKI